MPPTMHPDYDDLEEQITISGFKKNEELEELKEMDIQEELKELEIAEDFEGPEEVKASEIWEKLLESEKREELEELIKLRKFDYSKENFDLINERNLHAAFARSNQLFYPRSSHHGFQREQILYDPSIALVFTRNRILNHLTQAKLKAPLNLQKAYGDLISRL